ncbi:MAG: ArnT family glycosyltransferase, partial [Saprospiraceae bacterium]
MARKKQSPPKTSQTSPRSQAVENTIGSIDKLPTSLMLRVFGLFLMLSFLIYGVSLDFGFVLDDKIVLSENSFTKKGLEGISDLFAYDTFQGYFGEQKNILQGGRYRPLSLVSFALEYQLFGLNPMIFHLGNILIYALSVFVSFITLRRLFKEQKLTGTGLLGSTAFVAALIFLIHPIHTEAVANIKGRDEIMAFLFSMLTLFLCTKFYDTRKWQNLIFASLAFLLGLFSKENAITFLAVVPFAILLFRPVFKSRLIFILSNLVICTIIYLAVRINALGYLMIDNPSTDIMNNPFVNLDTLEKYGTIAYTLLVYLKLNF